MSKAYIIECVKLMTPWALGVEISLAPVPRTLHILLLKHIPFLDTVPARVGSNYVPINPDIRALSILEA